MARMPSPDRPRFAEGRGGLSQLGDRLVRGTAIFLSAMNYLEVARRFISVGKTYREEARRFISVGNEQPRGGTVVCVR